jgi:hypothetical protein
MAKKKEVVMWNESGYRKEYVNSFYDIDIVYHGAKMIFEKPLVRYTKEGEGALYDGSRLVFRINRQSQKVMMFGLRNYILSQMQLKHVDELEFINMNEAFNQKYNGFYKLC